MATSTASWSNPISARCSPDVYEWMPRRCIELTAFGLANRTRRSGSRRITPSPTRGASSNSSSSWRNGKLPSAIIAAKRSNVDR